LRQGLQAEVVAQPRDELTQGAPGGRGANAVVPDVPGVVPGSNLAPPDGAVDVRQQVGEAVLQFRGEHARRPPISNPRRAPAPRAGPAPTPRASPAPT